MLSRKSDERRPIVSNRKEEVGFRFKNFVPREGTGREEVEKEI